MTKVVDDARKLLESRLGEIEREAQGIREALASLGGTAAPARASTQAQPKRRSPKQPRKRVPRGQRRQQFLAAVKKAPGSSAAEVGKEIGVSTNQAYALGQRLLKDKEVKKSGKGYSLR